MEEKQILLSNKLINKLILLYHGVLSVNKLFKKVKCDSRLGLRKGKR